MIHIVRENWSRASDEFGFSLISPYVLSSECRGLEVFAFLPEFGSTNGAVVNLLFPPEFVVNEVVVRRATEHQMFYSFVNVERFLEYDRSSFKDLLTDWGKFKGL